MARKSMKPKSPARGGRTTNKMANRKLIKSTVERAFTDNGKDDQMRFKKTATKKKAAPKKRAKTTQKGKIRDMMRGRY